MGEQVGATHPGHYRGFTNGAEPIWIAEHLNFNGGNAVKYLSRSCRLDGENKHTNGEEVDLYKAAHYVFREIYRKTGEVDLARLGLPDEVLSL